MIDPGSAGGAGDTPRGVRRDLRYGVRTARRNPGFWLAVLVALALGIGASTAAVDFVLSGRLHTGPVASPEGLPIPPTQVELVSETEDPERVANSPVLGGALSSRASRPTAVAEQQREDLGVILTSLLGAAAVVLLVTVTNITLLLLARGGARRGEI
ncbi:MAG: hypothetical protein WD766_04080, partial [Gemmatimonadota bacterium]